MFAKIGDVVHIVIAKENLDWGYGKDIHEKTGKVVGFGEIHYGYVNNYGKEPGIYENTSWLKVEVDGVVHNISSCFCNVDGVKPVHQEGKRLRDLPETKF